MTNLYRHKPCEQQQQQIVNDNKQHKQLASNYTTMPVPIQPTHSNDVPQNNAITACINKRTTLQQYTNVIYKPRNKNYNNVETESNC